jgi:hypothetical protein
VALWFQQTNSSAPAVQIQDTSEGPAREVDSVDTAHFYWWEWQPLRLIALIAISLLFGTLAGVIENKAFELIDRHFKKAKTAD